MSRTNGKTSRAPGSAGFTLVELIVSITLSALIFAAILGGFTFLGQNLTRLVNARDQEAKSRRTFYQLGQDISAATKLSGSSGNGVLELTVPGLGDVRYVFNAETFTFTRTAPEAAAPHASQTAILLTNLSTLTFKYYNQAGTPLELATSSDVDLTKTGTQSVKEIELSFTSGLGNPTSGTRTVFAGKSPRFVLRNRPLLQ